MFDARSLYPSSSDARTRGGLLKTWAMTMFLFFCPSFLGGSLFFFAFFALLLGYQPSGCLSCCFSLTPTLCFPTLLSPFASSPHSPLLLLQLCSCLTVEAGSHSPPCLSFFSSCVFFLSFFLFPLSAGEQCLELVGLCRALALAGVCSVLSGDLEPFPLLHRHAWSCVERWRVCLLCPR